MQKLVKHEKYLTREYCGVQRKILGCSFKIVWRSDFRTKKNHRRFFIGVQVRVAAISNKLLLPFIHVRFRQHALSSLLGFWKAELRSKCTASEVKMCKGMNKFQFQMNNF